MHLVRYRESRDLLMATPPSLPQDFAPDVAAVRPVIDGVLRENRTWLDPVEMTRVFSAYGIPITPAALARDADEAVAAARPYLAAGQPPVVIKILVARHRAQVGSRRRAPQSRQRGRRARGRRGHSQPGAGDEARGAHHGRHGFSDDRAARRRAN